MCVLQVLPDGRPLPTNMLFNFTPEEIRAAGALYHKLNPITSQSSNLHYHHQPSQYPQQHQQEQQHSKQQQQQQQQQQQVMNGQTP